MTNRLAEALGSAPKLPSPQKAGWVTFAGDFNNDASRRFFNLFQIATGNGYTHLHLLIQSGGGVVGDGIAVHNLLKGVKLKVTAYNIGTVASIATVVYLGASERVVSETGSFMIHRTYATPIQVTSERVQAIGQGLIIDDNRVQAILKADTALTDEQWAIHKHSDLWLDAKAAVTAKISTSTGNFSPPLGESISNI